MEEPTTPQRIGWDFGLMLATVALLASLGVQSFLGTLYSWWAYRSIPGWEQVGQPGFIALMNAIAAPQVVALVVVMGLCVPKRLLQLRALAYASAFMLATGVVVAVVSRDAAAGLTAFLALAALIQVAVVVLTIAGTRAPSYLTEGRLTKTGSGLLHLGFVLFAIVVVALQRSTLMLPVFWASATLSTLGAALSFYAKPAADLMRRART